jgi:endonuclease/exonuclease/phosphatase family metal-dependent hydrolase
MIERVEKFIRRFRKNLSRTEWVAKFLNLPFSCETVTEPGFILIQIDGLSRTQLERSLARGRLPHLRNLLKRHNYKLKSLYSGLPSTTPAAQGELFFGVKTSVPAFKFFRRDCSETMVMYDPAVVMQKSRELEMEGEALLSGGSSYGNVYAGGAAEARYCLETMNLASFLKSTHPLKVTLILLLNFPVFFRILGLSSLEVVLAITDFFRGLGKKESFIHELKFIPSRLGICVLMRELIRFRVQMDAARGIPIIHSNFLCYDEHAHRRGPSSAFAHFTLHGIDAAIRDIHRAAQRSDCRDYRVLVFSDHGQESVTSYAKHFGRTLSQAAREVFAKGPFKDVPFVCDDGEVGAFLYQRGKNLIFTPAENTPSEIPIRREPEVRMTAMGPLGHIYFPESISEKEMHLYAEDLVKQAGVPLVLYAGAAGITGVNSEGTFPLRGRPENLLGKFHPFLTQVTEDLERLCLHPDSGDLVISGWKPGEAPMSFPEENGAHGGPGYEETRGFVLMPADFDSTRKELRLLDLRNKIRSHISGHTGRRFESVRPGLSRETLRILTWNIHSCISLDGKVFPGRTIRVIRSLQPDMVALQEVDSGKARTHYQNQAKLLSENLGMMYHFFPIVTAGDGEYGMAILSRFPIIPVKFDILPDFGPSQTREKRGAMWVKAVTPLGEVQLINTHMSLFKQERMRQMLHLLSEAWLGGIREETRVILCGDLNAGPRSPVYRRLLLRLRDIQSMGEFKGPRPTFYSRNPMFRLDHIFASRHFEPIRVEVPADRETRIASDHLPVFAELIQNKSSRS